jgi:hypothetical protein
MKSRAGIFQDGCMLYMRLVHGCVFTYSLFENIYCETNRDLNIHGKTVYDFSFPNQWYIKYETEQGSDQLQGFLHHVRSNVGGTGYGSIRVPLLDNPYNIQNWSAEPTLQEAKCLYKNAGDNSSSADDKWKIPSKASSQSGSVNFELVKVDELTLETLDKIKRILVKERPGDNHWEESVREVAHLPELTTIFQKLKVTTPAPVMSRQAVTLQPPPPPPVPTVTVPTVATITPTSVTPPSAIDSKKDTWTVPKKRKMGMLYHGQPDFDFQGAGKFRVKEAPPQQRKTKHVFPPTGRSATMADAEQKPKAQMEPKKMRPKKIGPKKAGVMGDREVVDLTSDTSDDSSSGKGGYQAKKVSNYQARRPTQNLHDQQSLTLSSNSPLLSNLHQAKHAAIEWDKIDSFGMLETMNFGIKIRTILPSWDLDTENLFTVVQGFLGLKTTKSVMLAANGTQYKYELFNLALNALKSRVYKSRWADIRLSKDTVNTTFARKEGDDGKEVVYYYATCSSLGLSNVGWPCLTNKCKLCDQLAAYCMDGYNIVLPDGQSRWCFSEPLLAVEYLLICIILNGGSSEFYKKIAKKCLNICRNNEAAMELANMGKKKKVIKRKTKEQELPYVCALSEKLTRTKVAAFYIVMDRDPLVGGLDNFCLAVPCFQRLQQLKENHKADKKKGYEQSQCLFIRPLAMQKGIV